MASPTLDFRDAQAFYQQTLTLARAYCPPWAETWPPTLSDDDVAQDVGLVLLKLFAQLAAYTAEMENGIPLQRRLAFFQFLNLQLRPPLPASAPLQFKLKPGRAPRRVPVEAAVLMPPDQTVRFQTAAELLVLPANMTSAMSLLPGQDEFIATLPRLCTGSTVPLFVADRVASARDDPSAEALGHWFLMGDPQLFKPDDSLQDIVITLSGKNLHAPYFGQWADAALAPLQAALTGSPDGLQLRIVLAQPPTAAARDIASLQAQLYVADGLPAPAPPPAAAAAVPPADPPPAQYWLLVKPSPQVKVLAALAEQLPVITGLQCTLRGKRVLPQQAACNTLLLDIHNGTYPFGSTPQQGDAFYLRCDPVFARAGALLTLHLDLTDLTQRYALQLGWQFWDGAQWQTLNQSADAIGRYQFVDSSDQLRGNSPVGATILQFQCPAMAPTTVAGSKGYWLRAVIASGGYGQPGGITATGVTATLNAVPDSILPAADKQLLSQYLNDVAGVNFSYAIDPGSYAPPFIKSLLISYSYAAQPASYWSYNAFALSRFLFSPFKPVEDKLSAFYFAFEPGDFGRYSVGNKLTLYFHVADEGVVDGSQLRWQWYDGAVWQALAVDDASLGLSRSGVVAFVVPAAMPAAELFSQTGYWFRIERRLGHRRIAVHGIYPNVVAGRNVTTLTDEVLGASNAQPDQQFSLKMSPVLAGMVLEVIEPHGLDAAGAELSSLGSAPATDSSASRRWQQVETFAFSGPADRVFTLDHQTGLISFGNGRNGMIPPTGHNNIIARRYEVTRGLAGNVAAGSLTLLRPGLSDIEQVSNPAPALGGVGGDSVADIERRGAALAKAAGRAVDLADLCTLALAADQRVAKARAIAQSMPAAGASVVQDRAVGPRIQVAVLALADDPVPHSSPELLQAVGQFLRTRCLAALAPRIALRAPDFLRVDISAEVAVRSTSDQQQAVQQALAEALAGFMQPVHGGLAGRGWDFGQLILASSVSQFLRHQPGVSAVLGLSVNGVQDGQLSLGPLQLPVAGRMRVFAYSQAI